MSRRATPSSGRAPRARRAGYSLAAVMVAVVLLTIGVISLMGASISTGTFQTLAQNRTYGLAIARAYLEELRMRDPWTLTSEAAVAVTAEGTPNTIGAFTRTVTVKEVNQNLLSVTVAVDLPRGKQPVTLTTAVFRGAQTK